VSETSDPRQKEPVLKEREIERSKEGINDEIQKYKTMAFDSYQKNLELSKALTEQKQIAKEAQDTLFNKMLASH
jgi:hypothetical protein